MSLTGVHVYECHVCHDVRLKGGNWEPINDSVYAAPQCECSETWPNPMAYVGQLLYDTTIRRRDVGALTS